MLSYVKSPDVAAPVILGDPEENSFLCKGMFFVLPNSSLFTCKDCVAGKKVVLNQYVP